MIDNLKLIDSHLMSYMISHWIKMRIFFESCLLTFYYIGCNFNIHIFFSHFLSLNTSHTQ
jgi:hypothetical protein